MLTMLVLITLESPAGGGRGDAGAVGSSVGTAAQLSEDAFNLRQLLLLFAACTLSRSGSPGCRWCCCRESGSS